MSLESQTHLIYGDLWFDESISKNQPRSIYFCSDFFAKALSSRIHF